MAKRLGASLRLSGDAPDAQRIIQLLIEYTGKLEKLLELGKPVLIEPQVAIQLSMMRLDRPLHVLASTASQLIEYTNIDSITQLELQLRLAEFESKLEIIRRIA